MKHPRLRLDRIAHRSKRKLKILDNQPLHETSILVESKALLQERQRRLSEPHGNGARCLLDMFNMQYVDFVKLTKQGDYVAVDWPKQATHRLIGTSWNDEPTRAMPNPTYALSVCALPMRPRLTQAGIAIKKPHPRNAHAYNVHGAPAGKRGILKFLVIAMKAKIKLGIIQRLTSDECDILYKKLMRASLCLKMQRLLRDDED